MNLALLKKAFDEAKWLLLGSIVLLFGFLWLRVWLTSQLSLGRLRLILNLLPEQWERLSPVPFEQIATSVGRIALGYDEPLVLLVMTVWSIGRGSDVVSGELGRGTMEMLLAQPVRRISVLWSHASVTIVGTAVLATAAWLGTYAGLASVELEEPVAAGLFVPAALNLFALGAFLAGVTTLASSCQRDRWTTIGLIGTLYALEVVLKVVGRAAPHFAWLTYFSVFTAFEPQLLVSDQARAWALWVRAADGGLLLGGWSYHGVLVGLAALCYAVATWIFCRRDLPAPL